MAMIAQTIAVGFSMATSIHEWRRGTKDNGESLPLSTVNFYRSIAGMPPLEPTAKTNQPQQQITAPIRHFTRGVGTHLKLLLKELGINSDLCGEGCGSFAAQMDAWGIEGCQQNREAILERLRQRYKETSWKTSLNAAWQTIVSGKVFEMNVLHPLEWLVDEAVRRADSESKASLYRD